MKNSLLRGVVTLSAVLLFSNDALAQVLGTSARQMAKGTLETTLFYQGTAKQHLNFEVTDGGTCSSNNTLSLPAPNFTCGSTQDIEGRGTGEAMVAKFHYKPAESGFSIYATAGVGDYSVKVGSVSVFNGSLEDQAGFLASFGTKALILPDTIVSPAVGLDMSVGLQRYFGGGKRFDMFQVQIALEASHRFDFDDTQFKIEPYGGVKWLRNQVYLKDLATQSRVGGRQNTITPFLGFKVPVFDKDAIFAEISMVEGVQYASGLMVRFK